MFLLIGHRVAGYGKGYRAIFVSLSSGQYCYVSSFFPLWSVWLCFQATGSWDYTVRLWTLDDLEEESGVNPKADSEENTEEGRERVCVLGGHKGNIHAVAFSKEDMLVSEVQ